MLVDQSHNFLVDLTYQHHFHDIHGFGIGNPHALDIAWLYLHLLKNLVDLRAPAMNDNWIYADIFHQDNIQGEIFLKFLVHHGMSAIFNNHGLIVKFPNIWQGFNQDFRFFNRLFHYSHRCVPITPDCSFTPVFPISSQS